jgi:hypothetical protein
MTDEKNWREHDTSLLLDGIEKDSEAFARSPQSCRPSSNFGPNEQRCFASLIRHRRHLIAKLERLRRVRPNAAKPAKHANEHGIFRCIEERCSSPISAVVSVPYRMTLGEYNQ